MTSSSAPIEHIEVVAAAHRRMIECIDGLSDIDMRKPSLLPHWSVGHVLTHLARNADSHVRRAEAAVAGVVVDQYPGGYEARAAEIEAGASRPAGEIIDDVQQSAVALEQTWHETPDHAWSSISRDVGGRERELGTLPARRWQEVEVHLVDLDIGITHRDWSDQFVAEWLPRSREQILRKLEPGSVLPQFDDPREELAWLYGRLRRDDLPAPPAWG